MNVPQPGSLMRFWLWASIGVVAMFGTFSFAGPVVWPLLGAGIGLLAARSVTRARRASCRSARPRRASRSQSPSAAPGRSSPGCSPRSRSRSCAPARRARRWPARWLSRIAVLLALRYADIVLAVALAPALLVLAALAAGRPQREAAGAVTGAGLALFTVGAPVPGISLTLAGAMLMLALGLRRRRLAMTSA